MDVLHAQYTGQHHCWNSDSSETLLITSAKECVDLFYLDGRFLQFEASRVSLSGEEARDLASRIRRVIAGEKGVNPDPYPEPPHLIVRYTNSGDPFREGVALCLQAGDYMRDFTFEVGYSAAGYVATSLEKAADAIGPAAPAE